MTSFTPKQLRNIGEAALTGNTPTNAPVLSEDALAYVDGAAQMSREATEDPYLNGQDAARRLHGGG